MEPDKEAYKVLETVRFFISTRIRNCLKRLTLARPRTHHPLIQASTT